MADDTSSSDPAKTVKKSWASWSLTRSIRFRYPRSVTSGDRVYSSVLRFEDLNLSKELLKGIYTEMRFLRPSKMQAVRLPMILTPPYKDLVAQP